MDWMAIVTLLSKLEVSFFSNLLERKLCWFRISQDGLQLANLDYHAEDYWRFREPRRCRA